MIVLFCFCFLNFVYSITVFGSDLPKQTSGEHPPWLIKSPKAQKPNPPLKITKFGPYPNHLQNNPLKTPMNSLKQPSHRYQNHATHQNHRHTTSITKFGNPSQSSRRK
jgi:hypothetical protein